MDSVYKELKKYIKNIRKNSDGGYVDLLTFDVYSLSFYGLILSSIITLICFIFLSTNIYLIIISLSLFVQAFNIAKYGFKKLIGLNMLILLILFACYITSINLIFLPIFILASIPLIKVNIKNYKIKQLSNFYLFEENGIKGCNLIIKEIIPIKSYNELIKINIKVKEELTLKEINDFNNNFLLFTDKIEQIFIGFKYDSLNYEVYLYSNNIDLTIIKEYLNNTINYEYSIKKIKDSKYKFYLKEICPSDKLFMHMCNQNILNNKLPIGTDLYKEQSLVLVLAFKEKENAMECMKHLESTNEYELINYDDNKLHVEENNLSDKYNNLLYIKQKTRIGLSKLNMITDKMFDLASKYEGTFEEWGLAKDDE